MGALSRIEQGDKLLIVRCHHVVVVGATTAVAAPMAMPAYRYIYQPDRILVVDPYTNIAVQAIPR